MHNRLADGQPGRVRRHRAMDHHAAVVHQARGLDSSCPRNRHESVQRPGRASATIDNVYVQSGNNVLSINRAGASSLLGSATTDTGQLLTFAQKALSKLGVAVAAAKKASTTTTAKKK